MKYTQARAAIRPTYRTPKFGNLLSDTYQGEVSQAPAGSWDGWLMNYSRPGDSVFRFGFRSRAAAARWVNAQLRKLGVTQCQA